MKRFAPRIALYSSVCVLVLTFISLSAVSARAQRRDFAGSYRLSNVIEVDKKVELTITLTIHNFSGAKIRNAGVVLYGSSPRRQPIGAFKLIKLFPSYRDISISQQFTVPEDEYALWRNGANPRLEFLLPVGEETRAVPIDLRREVERQVAGR